MQQLGVFTGRDIPLYRLFQWQGKANGFTKGEIEVFILEPQYKIIGMISHLGRN
jgi:2-oxoisovalerate dehydrogenase E1 component